MDIKESITCLKGIGPKHAKTLEKLEIRTIEDFLSYYPRTYQDRSNCIDIAELQEGEISLIRGKITLIVRGGYGYGKKRNLKVLVSDRSGSIEIIFFNASYLEKTINRENEYEFYGKVTVKAGRLQMVHPEFNLWKEGEGGGILPVYPLTGGITQNNMRKWQKEALLYAEDVSDYMPEEILVRNRLCSLQYAIENIHFPKEPRKAKEAAFRLVFDELFILQLGLLSIKRQNKTGGSGIAFSAGVKTETFVSALPFDLTKAQKRVIKEVENDMEKTLAMNRLIQGDVGSGKTAVAAAAAYKAIKSGYQAVLMAPTELLAQQHFDSLNGLFEKFGIKTGLLTGSMTQQQRKSVQNDILTGKTGLVIGTHALIQPGVEYSNVGLVITDEQHRFGVNQRNLLSKKGENPDVLVMTATPIPRTLAVILYGDLDHSIIDEMPLGRKPIMTKVVSDRNRNKAYAFLRERIDEGRQAYIVAPLIEDSEHLDAKSSVKVYQEVIARFKDLNVRLLHGNMKQSEKDAVMEEFYLGDVHILVSTVVIEVGINVPNAAVMLIENAERFGLATLHQLRGRVGRGVHQSFCILITDSKNEVAKERARVMEETNDGFVIAEKDLQLRGPGEFFGVKQHGIPQLHMADLSKHLRILETVRKEAMDLLDKDPALEKHENALLKEKMRRLFKESDTINI